jgi:hypothetical protein
MSTPTHPIALPRLTHAMHLVVRGFGSTDAEVQAIAGKPIEANSPGTIHAASACCRATPRAFPKSA